MLVIASHALVDRERAYLNASLEILPNSGIFLAPPARQSPKEAGGPPFLHRLDKYRFRRFLPRMAHAEIALPVRTTGPRGEPSPAALAARASWPPEASHPETSPVLPKHALHRSLRRRLFSESHVQNSPPCHSGRAFGPSKRPFTRLPLRACGP
jgi:hypothetical protein